MQDYKCSSYELRFVPPWLTSRYTSTDTALDQFEKLSQLKKRKSYSQKQSSNILYVFMAYSAYMSGVAVTMHHRLNGMMVFVTTQLLYNRK